MKSNYDVIETKDIIAEYYDNNRDLILKPEYDKAWHYILYSFLEGQVFSDIIKNMPANLTYTVHLRSFHIVFTFLKDVAIFTDSVNEFCKTIMRADDINFYDKNNIFDLNITPEGKANYLIHETKAKKAYVATFEDMKFF